MSSSEHTDASHNWLIFFMVCFWIIMGIGLWAIFCYDCNKVEPAPSGGHGMIIPKGGEEWAPHAFVWPQA